MILVLGGTTEGRIAVQTLEEAGKPFYYSTKGNEQEVPLHNGIRLQGGMDKDSLESFCRKENISLLIDAAHPFAEELHRNVSETADILQIPVIRYERIYPRIENNEGIVWCDNYEDAIRQIKKEEVYIILALTGVNSISKLKALWMESSRCYFRILDRESSRESARNQGFPEEYLRYYHTGEDEPMMNVLVMYEDNKWIVFVFPRAKHRPACYTAEGDANLLSSPASVDLGGVFITPVEKDFIKITAEDIAQILGEVCLSPADFQKVRKRIQEQL